MKLLICPDSFKSCLSAQVVAEAMAKGVQRFDKEIEMAIMPMSDGGEGTAAILGKAMQFSTANLNIQIENEQLTCPYFYLEKQAIFDVASVVPYKENHPIPIRKRDSAAVGWVIKELAKLGFDDLTVCLGGSGCHDAGIGMVQALGFSFYNKQNERLEKAFQSLHEISHYTLPENEFSLKITALCDVKNTLTGKMGSVQMFSPQKGANAEDMIWLEQGFENLGKVVKEHKKIALHQLPNTGSAGGLSFGLLAFLGAQLQEGFQKVQEVLGFEKALAKADLIITGEGTLDASSAQGKVVGKVAEKAQKAQVPVAVICGQAPDAENMAKRLNLLAVIPLIGPEVSKEDAMARAEFHIEDVCYTLLDYLKNHE